MKKQILFPILMLAMIGCLAIAPAQAQDTGKISIFGGYSYASNNFELTNNTYNCNYTYNCVDGTMGMHGYTLAVTYNANKNIGFEANITGHNGGADLYDYPATSTNYGYAEGQKQDLYTFTFGPKFTLPVGNYSLFTHVLVGAMRAHIADAATCTPPIGSSSTCGTPVYYNANAKGTGMAVKTGGGIDWNHGHMGVRILEVDFVHSMVPLAGNYSNSGGTVYPYNMTSGANNFELSTGFTFNF
jgi:hypothetical protein